MEERTGPVQPCGHPMVPSSRGFTLREVVRHRFRLVGPWLHNVRDAPLLRGRVSEAPVRLEI